MLRLTFIALGLIYLILQLFVLDDSYSKWDIVFTFIWGFNVGSWLWMGHNGR